MDDGGFMDGGFIDDDQIGSNEAIQADGSLSQSSFSDRPGATYLPSNEVTQSFSSVADSSVPSSQLGAAYWPSGETTLSFGSSAGSSVPSDRQDAIGGQNNEGDVSGHLQRQSQAVQPTLEESRTGASLSGGMSHMATTLTQEEQRVAASLPWNRGHATLSQPEDASPLEVQQGRSDTTSINLNPQTSQQVPNVPYLVEAPAERMAQLFPGHSIDEIVANNLIRGDINWYAAADGAFRVLRSGGEVSIAPYAGSLREHLNEIVSAFESAGFRDVRIENEYTVTARKP